MIIDESWALVGLVRALQAAHPISSDANLRHGLRLHMQSRLQKRKDASVVMKWA